MSKLLSVLLAGLFAAGAAFAQTSTTKPSTTTSGAGAGSLSGSVSGSLLGSSSTGTNTNTNTATSNNANVNANENTNTNTVNVYGPGSNKLARQQQQPGSTGVSMLPGHGKTSGTNTASNGSSDKACPPGLEKKDNGCMPPGLTRQMGASAGSTDHVQGTSRPTTRHSTRRD
jgi:hypothetical protein